MLPFIFNLNPASVIVPIAIFWVEKIRNDSVAFVDIATLLVEGKNNPLDPPALKIGLEALPVMFPTK